VHEIVDLEMTLVTVSNRDRKLVIRNFMEELCDYYRFAVENKIDVQFNFREFNNFSLLTKFLKEDGVEGSADQVVVDTLKEYAKESGYIDIHGDMVSLTEKGLDEYNKHHHDWG
jgi:hypothetical protein